MTWFVVVLIVISVLMIVGAIIGLIYEKELFHSKKLEDITAEEILEHVEDD